MPMPAQRPKKLVILSTLTGALCLALSGYARQEPHESSSVGRNADRAGEMIAPRASRGRAATHAAEGPPRRAPAEPARCRVPGVPILETSACDRGSPYPACKWRVPHPAAAESLYTQWRNTDLGHWWGRPALVSLVLATARQYARIFPGEVLAIGDLDAPGPRHETHEDGVDVDLYLPGMMIDENLGRSEYVENYAGRSPLSVRTMQGHVETLARSLAECSHGRVRIYYNDRTVQRRFHAWFRSLGLRSPFGRPMQSHNDLHRFHFHVTIPEDLERLPRLSDG